MLLYRLVHRGGDPARRRSRDQALGDVDCAQHLLREGRQVRPSARIAQLRRGRRGARRDARHREVRHRAPRGLQRPQLRHRDARVRRDRRGAESLCRRRYQEQERQADSRMAGRPKRHSRRLFRRASRDVHLRGQGVHSPHVRRVAAREDERLHRVLVLHPSSVLLVVHHRGARQLALGRGLQRASERDDAGHRRRHRRGTSRGMGHRREREGIPRREGHRHNPRGGREEHGRLGRRALGQAVVGREGGADLQP